METLQQLLQAIADAGPKGLRIKHSEHITLVKSAQHQGYIREQVSLGNVWNADSTDWRLTYAGQAFLEAAKKPKPDPPPPAPDPSPAPKPDPPPPAPIPAPPDVPPAPPAPADPHADLRQHLTKEALLIIDRAATMEQMRELLKPINERALALREPTDPIRTVLTYTRTNARKWARDMKQFALATVDE